MEGALRSPAMLGRATGIATGILPGRQAARVIKGGGNMHKKNKGISTPR